MIDLLYYTAGPYNWIFLNTVDVVNEAFVQRQEDFAGRPQITSGNQMLPPSLIAKIKLMYIFWNREMRGIGLCSLSDTEVDVAFIFIFI